MITANLPQPRRRRTTVRMAALVGYLIAATATGIAGAASTAGDVPSVVVRYADLDLACCTRVSRTPRAPCARMFRSAICTLSPCPGLASSKRSPGRCTQ